MTSPRIVGITGNLTRPSRTRTLVAAILAEISARELGETELFDLSDAGPDLGTTLSRTKAGPAVDRVLAAIETANLLVVASPVYKASYTGLFKHLFDLIDPAALDGRPVLLAATGASDSHALVIDHQLRPLFAFFGASILARGLYAANADFISPDEIAPALRDRISRTVDQIAVLPRMA